MSFPQLDFWNILRCQRTYIEVLRDIQPEEEENEAKLTPDQIMEFFEACDTLLALPGNLLLWYSACCKVKSCILQQTIVVLSKRDVVFRLVVDRPCGGSVVITATTTFDEMC